MNLVKNLQHPGSFSKILPSANDFSSGQLKKEVF